MHMHKIELCPLRDTGVVTLGKWLSNHDNMYPPHLISSDKSMIYLVKQTILQLAHRKWCQLPSRGTRSGGRAAQNHPIQASPSLTLLHGCVDGKSPGEIQRTVFHISIFTGEMKQEEETQYSLAAGTRPTPSTAGMDGAGEPEDRT